MILSLTTRSHMIQLNFNFLRRTNKKYKNVHPTHKCPMKGKNMRIVPAIYKCTCMSLARIHVKYMYFSIAYCTCSTYLSDICMNICFELFSYLMEYVYSVWMDT